MELEKYLPYYQKHWFQRGRSTISTIPVKWNDWVDKTLIIFNYYCTYIKKFILNLPAYYLIYLWQYWVDGEDQAGSLYKDGDLTKLFVIYSKECKNWGAAYLNQLVAERSELQYYASNY